MRTCLVTSASRSLLRMLVPVLMASVTHAQVDAGVRLDEGYGDAFLRYRPYVIEGAASQPTPTAPTPQTQPPQAAPAPAAAASAGRQPVDVTWLRKNYPILQQRAIDKPDDRNMSAYLYVTRAILDKSQRFGEAQMEMMRRDPLLNENNRVPYASTGARSIANANLTAQEQAVRELAKIGGLIIFVDGTCRFCAAQLPVAAMVRENFGLQYLVVSLDGAAPAAYSGPLQRDNGLFRKLGLSLTPSIVFVPKPKGYADGVDPNAYLVVAQGFYAASELVRQVAYAGHSSQLLSAKTMTDLDVWDRGVTSIDDLQTLQLDPDKPEDIKATLQPLLLKQYDTAAMPRGTGAQP